MNVSSLTIRDLEYLVNVARYLHFGKAAAACHVSQPALSSQIKKFEAQLGFPVFERTNRRVALTERGRAVVDQARLVLEEAQKIASLAAGDSSRGMLHGTLRIGAIITLGPYYVPRFLPAIRKAYPDLQLILREGLTDTLLEELRQGELDIVLAARTFQESGFRVFSLFHEPFVLAVPKQHPLAKKKELRPSDLKAADMIFLEDGHCLRDQALEICPQNRRGSIRQFHATSLETLRQLVAAGLGYTLMPQLAAQPDRSLGGLLKYRSFQNKKIGREIVLVCRERYPRMKDVERLVDLLRGLEKAKQSAQ